MLKSAVESIFLVATACLICAGTSVAGDLHPIVEVKSGYLFGALSDGKPIQAEETAKSIGDETTYRVYGLTRALGDAKGGKPESPEAAPCDILLVPLSPKPENAVIGIAAPWNALPRTPKVIDTAQKIYVDAVRDFLKTKAIDQPKVKIDSILRADLDGDGEEEVLISATNYLSANEQVPMRSPAGSYSMVLLRRIVAGKVETRMIAGEFHAKAYPRKGPDDASFDAPNAYKVMAVLDLDGDGKMEIVVGSNYYEGEEIRIYSSDPKNNQPLLSVACGA